MVSYLVLICLITYRYNFALGLSEIEQILNITSLEELDLELLNAILNSKEIEVLSDEQDGDTELKKFNDKHLYDEEIVNDKDNIKERSTIFINNSKYRFPLWTKIFCSFAKGTVFTNFDTMTSDEITRRKSMTDEVDHSKTKQIKVFADPDSDARHFAAANSMLKSYFVPAFIADAKKTSPIENKAATDNVSTESVPRTKKEKSGKFKVWRTNKWRNYPKTIDDLNKKDITQNLIIKKQEATNTKTIKQKKKLNKNCTYFSCMNKIKLTKDGTKKEFELVCKCVDANLNVDKENNKRYNTDSSTYFSKINSTTESYSMSAEENRPLGKGFQIPYT